MQILFIQRVRWTADNTIGQYKMQVGKYWVMMTSSNGKFSTLLAICVGNSPVTGEFPAHRPVTWSFDVFFDLCLNERLSKQSWGWGFEMPSCPLWRHSNGGGLNQVRTNFRWADATIRKMPTSGWKLCRTSLKQVLDILHNDKVIKKDNKVNPDVFYCSETAANTHVPTHFH